MEKVAVMGRKSIGSSLIASFLGLSLLLSLVGFLGLGNMSRLATLHKNLYGVNLSQVLDLTQSEVSYLQIVPLLLNLVGEPDAEKRAAIEQELDQGIQLSERSLQDYSRSKIGEKDRKSAGALLDQLPDLSTRISDWESRLGQGRTEDSIATATRSIVPKIQEIDSVITQLLDSNRQDSYQGRQDVEAIFNSSRVLLLAIIIAAIAVALIVGLALRAAIVRPLKNVLLVAKAVSSGDLTVAPSSRFLKRRDELGQMAQTIGSMRIDLAEKIRKIDRVVTELIKMAEDLRVAMDSASLAVGGIAASSEVVNAESLHQSASVVETTATVSAMVKNIGQLRDRIRSQAAVVSESSATIAGIIAGTSTATSSLQQMTAQFGKLLSDSEEGRERLSLVVDEIGLIAKDSEKLTEANEVVNNIASQTSLLAMNAAIEAAHAGDAGKGFAVVAEEIRKLAERAATQSKEISGNIDSIRQVIERVVVAADRAEVSFELIQTNIRSLDQSEKIVNDVMVGQNLGSNSIRTALDAITTRTSDVEDYCTDIDEGACAIDGEMQRLLQTCHVLRESVVRISNEVLAVKGTAEAVNSAIADNQRLNEHLSEMVLEFTLSPTGDS
jgi:methyl-accepting chemotaxis protein